jgi:hypothetical protein
VQTECTETLPLAALPNGRTHTLAGLWAVAGIALLFGRATWALGSRGAATVAAGLQPVEWLILAGLVGVFLYGEGVLALQRKWVPRVCARIEQLRDGAPLPYRLLAPFYAMSLLGGPARGVLRAWAGVVAIILAVLVVSRFPQPWRGIVDLAVAAALGWGLLVLVRSGTAVALGVGRSPR